jgi:transcriptional regulator GlxA family with amidase domain
MNGTDEVLFKRAQKAIVSHKLYLREVMSRKMLDKYVHIPKNKFADVFRKHTGFAFPQYINSLRLEVASKMLLEQPKHTIESIACDCGIPVAQTFYRIFREKYGMTPTAYRKKYLK